MPMPVGGRRVLEDSKKKQSSSNISVESACSCSTASCGKKKKVISKGRAKKKKKSSSNGLIRCANANANANNNKEVDAPLKRCHWITPNSDPLYTSFHDEEWGVPVYDDRKLFELLVLCQALAEFTWPLILNKRHLFRKVFENFDPASIAKFDDKKMLNGSILLSETKLRAVVENANQMLKVEKEFGSFSNYLWGFVKNKAIRNGFKYGREVPARTPKAEVISKDLMQRGFRCVGPIIVYSFMQVAGLVNDHLLTCFRHQQCCNCTIAVPLTNHTYPTPKT